MKVTSTLEVYRRWHLLQMATKDIDPVYPVLREYMLEHGLSDDERAWLILLHVAYYHLGSALAVHARMPLPGTPRIELAKLPCATERRGHRDPLKLTAHWWSLLDAMRAYGGPYALLCAPSWAELTQRLTLVYGNGRWAAYKTAEMAQKVLGIPLTVPDAAHADSSGPRKGLSLLYGRLPTDNTQTTIEYLDKLTQRLADELDETDLGYVETSLCDFHSLSRGHYYLGNDIDQMLAQLYAVPSKVTVYALDARHQALPREYLGELHGWVGPDPARKTVFMKTGEIVERA